MTDLWSMCGSRYFTFLYRSPVIILYTHDKVINTQMVYRDE
jgi:hypothetical protein